MLNSLILHRECAKLGDLLTIMYREPMPAKCSPVGPSPGSIVRNWDATICRFSWMGISLIYRSEGCSCFSMVNHTIVREEQYFTVLAPVDDWRVAIFLEADL